MERSAATASEGCHEVECACCCAPSPMLFGGTRDVAEARLAGELGWRRASDDDWLCPHCCEGAVSAVRTSPPPP